MATLPPRAVLVTRETDYARLLAAHGTREQARFVLAARGQDLAAVAARHEAFAAVLRQVRAAVPDVWRLAKVGRGDLDRFLFEPQDVVLAVGQDGLVANLAKYLTGQPVLGINPAPDLYEGALVRLRGDQVARLAPAAAAGRAAVTPLTMAQAALEDGQTLRALNEIFIGHRSHQSARYEIEAGGRRERQSSSGVIVATGAGASGWARSIMTATGHALTLSPCEPRLAWFVREPWPSVATGATLTWGPLDPGAEVRLQSTMDDGGVIFADGVEQDCLDFAWGRTVRVSAAPTALNLVGPE